MLVGHWIHVHEEDGATHRVLRRVGAALPPSRGRMEYRITPNLVAHCSGPGGDDRHAKGETLKVVIGRPANAHNALPDDSLVVLDAQNDRLLVAR